MVLPCLISAFNNIGESCFGWVGELIQTEASHLIAYGENIDNLRKQVQNLSDAIKSLEDRIEAAENIQGATRVDAVVDRLLERMTSVKAEASTIISNEERESDCTCIIRLRPNLWACYQTSKSAKKAINEATQLLEEEKKLDRPVANVDYSNCLVVTPNPDFEIFESRVLVSNQIVEALKDPHVHKVGVYGMGGTGKTTLAKQIGVELQMSGTFSYVVLTTVSEKQSLLQGNYQSDLISIQKQIAEGLKIHLQDETLNARATQLSQQLQKKDKLLIILDDIWSKFELEMVGIPVGSKFTSQFKILMTSRSKMVLEKEMDSTSNFGLDSLPVDDARNLFDKMVDGDALYSNWTLIAHQVVDLCGGIPILLATTGRALRDENQSIWEDALTQLKQFNGEDFDEDAYKRIEVSYNFLKNEEIKKLLLLCAQLDHRSIGFEDLLRYTMGLDLFKGRKKVKEVSGRLHKYLRDLKGCCLLQDGNDEGMIKMHDVVHKFASFVASRDHGVFSVANDGELEEWPSKTQFEKFIAISFFYCRLPYDHVLPAAFDNLDLESFLMLRGRHDAPFKIPDNFFAGMRGLKLMHLTWLYVSPIVVSSFGALVKLRTLCLDHCRLSDITVIGELPMLQALSLVGSSIVLVPKEIGKLGSTLKLLDLRGCWKLERIAAGVISRLTLLEDLRIAKTFTSWGQLEGSDESSESNDVTREADVVSLEEFKNLVNLINLKIHVSEPVKMFPKDLVFKKLETFRIFIGIQPHYFEYKLSRTLLVDESSTTVEFDSEGSKTLMTRADGLLLKEVTSSVSVSQMDPKGFPEMKHLKIYSAEGIQYIVKKNYSNCIFPKLETLNLSTLNKLESICVDNDHPLAVGSFKNLRVIKVSDCHLLNYVLSSNFARCLLRLEEIDVRYCESMKNIIVSRESENEEEIQIGFTHELQVLKLEGLSCLVSFYSCKQVEELPSPTIFFNKKIVFLKLEELHFRYMKIEKIWDEHLAVEGAYWFQNLTILKVCGCHNLSYLFTFSMVKSLPKLKQLRVEVCHSMKEIVATKKGEMEAEGLLLFPKLESLTLLRLPHLKRFCHVNSLECPSLQALDILGCPLLNTFMSTNDSTYGHFEANSTATLLNEKIIFPQLQDLGLGGMKSKKIWDDHLTEGTTCWFQNLTSLRLYIGCSNLSYVFTFSMVKYLTQLQKLTIVGCRSIEEIVASKGGEMEGESLLLFPKLEVLQLQHLKSLTSFCSTSHCNFRFPSLNWVIVANCPKMKFFSMGALSTPNLTRVFPFWLEVRHEETDKNRARERWEGDLNSTIRQLFEETVMERDDKDEDEGKDEDADDDSD